MLRVGPTSIFERVHRSALKLLTGLKPAACSPKPALQISCARGEQLLSVDLLRDEPLLEAVIRKRLERRPVRLQSVWIRVVAKYAALLLEMVDREHEARPQECPNGVVADLLRRLECLEQ